MVKELNASNMIGIPSALSIQEFISSSLLIIDLIS